MPGRTYPDRVLNITHFHPPHAPPHVDMLPDDHSATSPRVSQDFPAVYPAPSIPPPLHIHHYNLPSYRANYILIPPGHLHLYPGLHPTLSSPPWPHRARVQSVVPVPPPPPPPILHKVWILDCMSCGTFFTNRGMKAVLLLRPNVPLYSTDALPINCSADSAAQDTPSAGSSTSTLLPSSQSIAAEHVPSRSCECLTQTLCCHGCGSSVGYMIVIPCQRCTSSITASNRATNGHRFVFYSSEVTAGERRYITGERGVLVHGVPRSYYRPPQVSLPPRHSRVMVPPLYTPRSSHTDYLPTPPPEVEHSFPSDASPDTSDVPAPISPSPPSDPFPADADARPPHSTPHSPLVSSLASAPPPPAPQPQALRAGDVLFWHHLARSGEIPAVVDDARARGVPGSDAHTKWEDEARVGVSYMSRRDLAERPKALSRAADTIDSENPNDLQ